MTRTNHCFCLCLYDFIPSHRTNYTIPREKGDSSHSQQLPTHPSSVLGYSLWSLSLLKEFVSLWALLCICVCVHMCVCTFTFNKTWWSTKTFIFLSFYFLNQWENESGRAILGNILPRASRPCLIIQNKKSSGAMAPWWSASLAFVQPQIQSAVLQQP